VEEGNVFTPEEYKDSSAVGYAGDKGMLYGVLYVSEFTTK
jgi:hypothetical protein